MRSAVAILCIAGVLLASLMGGGVVAAVVLYVATVIAAAAVVPARARVSIPRPVAVMLRGSRHLPRASLPASS